MFYKFLFIFILILTFTCKEKVQVSVSGSESMHEMILVAGNDFVKKNTQYEVLVKGGGSVAGLEEFISGQADIALISRDPRSEDLEKLKAKKFEKQIVGYDGTAIVVNQSNPVSSIILSKASDVFTGKIKSWKDLGGKDEPIHLLIRNEKSGTGYFFLEHVVRKLDIGGKDFEDSKKNNYSSDAKIISDNEVMAKEILADPNAIGFMGMGVASHSHIKKLKYARTEKEEPFEPTIQTVNDRKYKLSRPLNVIYTPGVNKVDAFITFLTSEEGQQSIQRSGYLRSTLPEVEVEAKKEK